MAAFLGLIGLLLLGLPLAAAAAPKDAPAPRDSPSQAPAPDSRLVEGLPPVIERIMPFSSCNPGGAVLLQGKNFGSSPGRLRIIGYFPNGWIDLEKLEWGTNAIGGQVPMVEGALDQPVSIQAVASDGKVSNRIPCEFKATRVEVALAGGKDYAKGYCHLGDNYWSGNDFYDKDDHQQAGNPSGATIICYHKSDKPTTHGDNDGTDVWTIRKLENDWKLSRMPFADYSGGSGEILSRAGFQPGSTTANLEFRWRMGHDAVVHYSFQLYATGPVGVPMHEPVELPAAVVQQIDDWNPIAPKGHVPLTIVSPSSTIRSGATSFDLAITADSPQPGWTIQLEWAELTRPKDASLGNESWDVGTPDSAPKLVAWSALPMTLATVGRFEGRDYAVRARVQGQADDTWTDWKRFQLAGAVSLQAKPSLGGPKAERAAGETLTAAPIAAPEASKLRPATGLSVPRKSTADEKPSPSELKPRRAPGDTLAAPSKATSRSAAPTRGTGPAAPSKPTLALDTRGAKPSPSPTTDSPFGVQGLKVRNSGAADAARRQLPLKLRCVPLDGGSCQVNAGGAGVPAVPAGEIRPLPLEGVFQAGASGRYRIGVTLEAPNAKPENTWSREVTVTDPPRMQQAPKPPTLIRERVDPLGR